MTPIATNANTVPKPPRTQNESSIKKYVIWYTFTIMPWIFLLFRFCTAVPARALPKKGIECKVTVAG